MAWRLNRELTSTRPCPPAAARRTPQRQLDASERRRRQTGLARPARDGDHQLRRRQPLRLVSLPSRQPPPSLPSPPRPLWQRGSHAFGAQAFMLLALLILPLPDQYRKYVISFIDTVIFAK